MATSLFQSVASMFRPTTQVSGMMAPGPAPAMQQANPGAAATVPAAGTSAATTTQAAANPLDDIAALWQTDPNSKPVVDPLAAPLFNTDPAKIAEAAGKINFVSQLPPDLVAKAMSGNDPQAFMQVINAAVQRGVATSSQLNAATIEQATQQNNARVMQTLPGRVRQIQLDAMVSEDPVLASPAAQPFLQLARQHVQMKNPGMSAAEINRRAESVVTGFATALTAPAAAAAQQASNPAGTDWDSWAST